MLKNNSVIDRKVVDIFIKNYRLKGISGLLKNLQNKSSRKLFINFLSKNQYRISSLINNKEKLLFHGSNIKIKRLIPKESLVYASDLPDYAIFLAIISLSRTGSAKVNTIKNKTTMGIDQDFINGKSRIVPGYVHVVSSQTFLHQAGKEYISDKPVDVLFSIPVTYRDLDTPITLC